MSKLLTKSLKRWRKIILCMSQHVKKDLKNDMSYARNMISEFKSISLMIATIA
jgi:hypothetical protein